MSAHSPGAAVGVTAGAGAAAGGSIGGAGGAVWATVPGEGTGASGCGETGPAVGVVRGLHAHTIATQTMNPNAAEPRPVNATPLAMIAVLHWHRSRRAGERERLSLSRHQKISGRVEASQVRHVEAGGSEQLAILALRTLSSPGLVGHQHQQILPV